MQLLPHPIARLPFIIDGTEAVVKVGEYINPSILDGTQWSLRVCCKDIQPAGIYGSNAYPDNWNDLLKLLGLWEIYGAEQED